MSLHQSSKVLRESLAATVSSLRRVRPRVPFFQLSAHTLPTKWTLYRQLLRRAPTENIRSQVQLLFRRNRELTSPTATRRHLARAHKLLRTCNAAYEGNTAAAKELRSYDRFIAAKRRRHYWNDVFSREMKWQERLRRRPIMTGGHLVATLYNPPLPRLKPQPVHISGMIISRKRMRARRLAELDEQAVIREDLACEVAFEETLHRNYPQDIANMAFAGDGRLWDQIPQARRAELSRLLDRDSERARMQYTPEMLDMIRDARKEAVRNKTSERERERRGEMTRRAAKSLSQMPPARVWSKLTPKQQFEDTLMRSPSEGGFTGALKRRRGMRLHDDKTWRLEDGRKDNLQKLLAVEGQIQSANERKRFKASESGHELGG